SLRGNDGYVTERSSRPTPALKYLTLPTQWMGIVSLIGVPPSSERTSSRLSPDCMRRTFGAFLLGPSSAAYTEGLARARHAVTLTMTRCTFDCFMASSFTSCPASGPASC